MEFVDGVPLTGYCREGRLSVRARVALVRGICAALDYAHQHLVVHRDLKPSNILVTADGIPKVLDFGIAKLLGPDAAETGATIGLTSWTPDYASPEQVLGKPVSTRSDVYSLGLVLYEVLTGQAAQQADGSSPVAIARSVCETEPPLASARVAATGERALARELRGDLDTIVAMAIRKEPERRYASMAAFADDLGRYLQGLPVAARPNTWTYRARKFVARHRVAAVAAVLVAASVAGGTAAAVYQAQRAERRFAQVRGLANAFVFDVHDRIAALPGATEARRAIVRTALTYLENLREEATGDAALAHELAAAYERIGTVQDIRCRRTRRTGRGAAELRAGRGAAGAIRGSGPGRDARANRHRRAQAGAGAARPGGGRGQPAGLHAGARRRRARHPRRRHARRPQCRRRGVRRDGPRIHGPARPRGGRRGGRARHGDCRTTAGVRPRRCRPAEQPGVGAERSGPDAHGGSRFEDAAAIYARSVAVRELLVRDAPTNVTYRRALMVSYGNVADVLGARTGENLGDVAGATAAREPLLARATAVEDAADRRARFDVVNALLRLGALLGDYSAAPATALARCSKPTV
jgi:hypothetical protein